MHYDNFSISKAGFTLPVVLIASTVMLMVLAAAGSLVSSTLASLQDDYYTSLASDAARSGITMAESCLYENSGIMANDAEPGSNKIRPGTGCEGGPQCSTADCYVVFKDGLRTTYQVDPPVTSPNGTTVVTVHGAAQLLRRDGSSVWKQYQRSEHAVVRIVTTPSIASGAGWKSTGHNGYMLSEEGILWGWGDNSSRQLGDSSLGSVVKSPVRIDLPTGMSYVKKIAGSGQGASFLCGLMVQRSAVESDTVYCRGNGGLGMGSSGSWMKFSLPPAPVQYPVDLAVQGYGKDGACVLTNIGNVYCVGTNDSGRLGLRTTSNTFVPLSSQAKLFKLPGSLKATEVFTQDRHTCVIATDDKAYCAGDNALGQLGRGNISTNVWVGNSNPEKVQLPGNRDVAAGRLTYHGDSFATYFLAEDGRAYMAGAAWSGTANDGTTTNRYSTPKLLGTSGGVYGNIISVGQEGASNQGSICLVALSPEGGSNSGLWCSGATKFGQNGRGVCGAGAIQPTRGSPVVVPTGGVRINPDMGPTANYQMNSVMVIDHNGVAYAAGDNSYGKLGTGASYTACNSAFQKVKLPDGVKAVTVANGDEYTAFILGDDGNLYAMGRNNQGQLGNGTTTNSNLPVRVEIPRKFSLLY